jgi:hypothetical protein
MSHQLTDDTILFWDFQEEDFHDYQDQGDGGDGFTDVSGVYGQIYPFTTGNLRIARGANANVYGVGFHGTNYRLQNTTAMPAAILNAMHDGDITAEFYVRQYRYNNFIGWLGMAGGADGVEANNHQLTIYVGAGGVLYAFWEHDVAGTDVTVTSLKSLTAGSDHHVVFQRRDDGATCSARFIVDDVAEAWQTGFAFPTGGGNGGIIFGASTSQLSGTPNYPAEGVLGDFRLLKKLISDAEITANAALKATTAQLPYDATDSLFHYRFGSEMKPSLIDKSPNKLHLTKTNFSGAYEPLEIANQRNRVDFWRTGGRALAMHVGQFGWIDEQEIDRAEVTFREKLALVGGVEPDYTVQFLLCGRGENTFPNGQWLDFGPSTNRLLYLEIDGPNARFRIFWEYGSGTNMDYYTPNDTFSDVEARGLMHVGFKIIPGTTADKVKILTYVNGTLRDTSAEQFAATIGTIDCDIILGGNLDECWIQELKIDAPGETEEEIQANANSLPSGSDAPDTTPPVIQNMTPTPGVFPGTRAQAKNTPIEFDVTDIDPGLQIVVLTMKYAGINETLVVHNGSDFLYPFDSDESVRTAITDGFHFAVLPRDGWTANIDDLQVYAIDAHGNLEGGLP